MSARLGVFARCYAEHDPDALGRRAADDGFSLVQLNLSALQLPTLPGEEELAALDLPRIAGAFADHGVGIWGLSCSYNMAHPSDSVRAAQTAAAVRLIRRAPDLGAAAVTLCTGTRDPDDMWRRHPDNGSESAWADMRRSLDALLESAEAAGVVLAVEPEPGNVIADADAAQRLVRELGDRSGGIGFILDPANLVAGRPQDEPAAVLRDAFDRLGSAAVCVHAKDVVPWGSRLGGAQGIDFGLVRQLHAELPHDVPIIIQDATPEQLPGVRALVEDAG
ncbi:MAG: sugar phosphate isomerase/epimerase family protein [Microbacterium sp.]